MTGVSLGTRRLAQSRLYALYAARFAAPEILSFSMPRGYTLATAKMIPGSSAKDTEPLFPLPYATFF